MRELRPLVRAAPKSPAVKRYHSIVSRREGKYNLYRCLPCLRAKFGNAATPEQLKSVSFSNLKRHHDAAHRDEVYLPVRSDVYVQTAGQEPKLLKQFRTVLPLMHLCDYYPPPPFYVEPNPDPI